MPDRTQPHFDLTPTLLQALVRYARALMQPDEPLSGFIGRVENAWNDACGCMGPQGGDPLCPCRMRHALKMHLVHVLNEISPDAALAVMRRRIIAALP